MRYHERGVEASLEKTAHKQNRSTNPKEADRIMKEEFEQTYALFMESSLWREEKTGKWHTNNQSNFSHFMMVVESVIADVAHREDDPDEGLVLLSNAFASHRAYLSGSTNDGYMQRNKRELGSAQSRMAEKMQYQWSQDTLAKEADLLESMWDTSMMHKEGSHEEEENDAWKTFWQLYENRTDG